MTTDRELLEAAAKAAGLDLQHKPLFSGDAEPGYYDYSGGTPKWTWWNPLTDDGDAFRLAVRLNLLLMPYPDDNAVRVTRLDQPDTIVSWGTPPDALAATRRAIVRAAAEIGASK